MSQTHVYINPARKLPLDTRYYGLNQDELDFFQELTGIKDEDELKLHIIAVQARAYEIYGYPCIRSFSFTKLEIVKVPGYKQVLELLQIRENPIFLDIGCCFGNDTRRIVFDGWPVENVIASDLYPGFWDCGHELFKSTSQTFPAAFIPGDIFDSGHLASCDSASIVAFKSNPEPVSAIPLKDMRSLNALRGKVSAIFAGAFFHLFDEAEQLDAALRLASLLSPEKGSVIFGHHSGLPVTGYLDVTFFNQGISSPEVTRKVLAFCHSPQSWKEMWTKQVFGGKDDAGMDRVKVNVGLVEIERRDLKNIPGAGVGDDKQFYWLNWCITRL